MANEIGYIQFMDFVVNGEMVHPYCIQRRDVVNVLLDIAKGDTVHFSENDKAIVAEMIQKGYVVVDGDKFCVNAPVYTGDEYRKLKELFGEVAEEIAQDAKELMGTVTQILRNHIPVHLKKTAGAMAYLHLFEDVISAPVRVLCERKYLLPYEGDGVLLTTYIVLK